MSKKKLNPILDESEKKQSIALFSKNVSSSDIHGLTQGQYSRSSELAMTTDWNRFVEFCCHRHVSPLPASVTAVRLFLETESRSRKFSTVRRYSVTIGLIHKIHSLKDPCSNRQTKLILTQLKQTKSGDARQANAFTQAHIDKLHSMLLNEKSFQALRDLAIYHLMYECALKRSDLRKICFSDIALEDENAVVTITDSHYRLSAPATQVIRSWSEACGNSGYCFRRIDKHGNLGNETLDDSSVYRILRRASDRLCLPEEMRFTTQSARVGAAQTLKEQGYKLKDIQSFGRWLSPAMPAQYLSNQDIADKEMTKFKVIKPWK
ncbi:tyrosine-type recombinase/integrase [Vibrio sp. JC009]|uniref:tyrosine-type recombinase/integrase n=1 Tax=Vibrio sp. JC009 TaxID=2912314 RepID=UPI0023AF3AD7|nr:tyrosine-type recombinase/integrase [Vibrio sp. JC009]WED24379.1 tyrosine-type recombinase/integrase [Vibrio sp. JC009]